MTAAVATEREYESTMTGCIEYGGYRNRQGYGQQWANGRLWLAHRLVMARMHGETAVVGRVVMHACDNPACVNPDHLRIGSQSRNMADAKAKGRARGPNYRGEQNGRHRLTEAQVREIRERHRRGETQMALAEQFSVTQTNISCIVLRKTWAHVPD